jgi:hypothetical protein
MILHLSDSEQVPKLMLFYTDVNNHHLVSVVRERSMVVVFQDETRQEGSDVVGVLVSH